MTDAKAFNAVADQVEARFKLYEKAIALFKDLESWGPDQEGNTFKFQPCRHWFHGPLLIGTYVAPKSEKPCHIVIGIPTSEFNAEFEVWSGWSSAKPKNPEELVDEVYKNRDAVSYSTSQNVDTAVRNFINSRMVDHPRYQAAVQVGAQKVIESVKLQPVF